MSIVLLASCHGGQSSFQNPSNETELKMLHAAFLHLYQGEGYTRAEITNPWDTTKVLHNYLLVPHTINKDSIQAVAGEANATVVFVPLQCSVVAASPHFSLLREWNVLNAVVGVCDVNYMPQADSLLKKGLLADMGSSDNPNVELLLNTQPDAILLTPYQQSKGYGVVEQMGIPVIECADYMERSALGRAEWMRFFGRLYGVGNLADSVFMEVENNYYALTEKVKNIAQKARPKLMTETMYSGSWYVPTAQSTTGQLYKDAGANYAFAYLKGASTVPLSLEQVLDKAEDADVWLMKYNAVTDYTLQSLKQQQALYARFRPFKTHKVYGANTRFVPFYEETPFHPDRLLHDLVLMFHPECVDQTTESNTLRYFKLLQ